MYGISCSFNQYEQDGKLICDLILYAHIYFSVFIGHNDLKDK